LHMLKGRQTGRCLDLNPSVGFLQSGALHPEACTTKRLDWLLSFSSVRSCSKSKVGRGRGGEPRFERRTSQICCPTCSGNRHFSEHVSLQREVLTPLRKLADTPEHFIGISRGKGVNYSRMPSRCRRIWTKGIPKAQPGELRSIFSRCCQDLSIEKASEVN